MQTQELLQALSLLDSFNHRIKEGEWYPEDQQTFYRTKDEFLKHLYKSAPDGVEFQLLYVPYIRYSAVTKDKAGALMRNDDSKSGFEYYLSQVETGPGDIELPEKGSIKFNINYVGHTFCFHVPLNTAAGWGLDYSMLERKTWLSGKEHHHRLLSDFLQNFQNLASFPPQHLPLPHEHPNQQ